MQISFFNLPDQTGLPRMKDVFASRSIWLGILVVIGVPIVVAATSPLLAWRSPVYIFAGFAGVIGLALLLVQPLLAANWIGGLGPMISRRWHRWVGVSLVIAVLTHVVGLWITSPPDVVDALLFRSPTSFSVWGVIAMWGLFAAALLASLRRRLHWSPLSWKRAHSAIAFGVVGSTVAHAMLIDGTMGDWSKAGLCILVLLAMFVGMVNLRLWKR
jgi:predicted ferric reductase